MTWGVLRCLTAARQQQPERCGHMHPQAYPGFGRDGDNAEVILLPLGPEERQTRWTER